jgi:hypothetical protein
VLDRVDLLLVDKNGVAPGFDLDGHVSTSRTEVGCGFGDLRNRWGDSGVDNQFAKVLNLLPPQVGSTLPGALDTALAAGGMTMIVEPTIGANGLITQIRIVRGKGVPLLGTDGRILPSQTFALDDDPVLATADLVASDGETWFSNPFLLQFRMLFIASFVAFDMQQARIRLEPDGHGGVFGEFGGIVSLEQIIGLTALLGGCDATLSQRIKDLAPVFADASLASPGACDAITMGFRVHGVPAYLYGD